ncbi:PepSY domain-containing protein [Oceanobacillus rekensis]|uniref:PepSY domain-containing protein n=1 Tax=Oceanobacillus rekensis TaxID=937927 RepID=UPI000B445B39|nr:PepSY domain-containing protein [Oceanobacillus rekensis]
MKKKLMVTVAIVGVVAVLAFGFFQTGASSAEPTLSSKEIRDLVLKQYPPGTITELKYEEDANDAFYKVKLDSDGNLYQIKLNGNTGEVLDLKVDKSTSNNVAQNNKEKNEKEQKEKVGTEDEVRPEDNKQDDNADEEESSQKEKTNTGGSSGNAIISEARAKEIALGEFSGTVTEMELDEDDGLRVYEVEIEDGEDEATIEINAYTGEILLVEMDIEDDEEDN